MIDTLSIESDSVVTPDIDPKWIRKVEVVKKEKYKQVYGNVNGVIFIYPKRRFRDEFFQIMKIDKTVPNKE